MKRGDIVRAAGPGDYTGKPRPALIVQSDIFDAHNSITICPITSILSETLLFRVPVGPGEANGLLKPSEIEVDKITTIARGKIRGVIGRMDDERMVLVDAALRRWLGL